MSIYKTPDRGYQTLPTNRKGQTVGQTNMLPNMGQQNRHQPIFNQHPNMAQQPNMSQHSNMNQRPNINQHPNMSQHSNMNQHPNMTQQLDMNQHPNLNQHSNMNQHPDMGKNLNVVHHQTQQQSHNIGHQNINALNQTMDQNTQQLMGQSNTFQVVNSSLKNVSQSQQNITHQPQPHMGHHVRGQPSGQSGQLTMGQQKPPELGQNYGKQLSGAQPNATQQKTQMEQPISQSPVPQNHVSQAYFGSPSVTRKDPNTAQRRGQQLLRQRSLTKTPIEEDMIVPELSSAVPSPSMSTFNKPQSPRTEKKNWTNPYKALQNQSSSKLVDSGSRMIADGKTSAASYHEPSYKTTPAQLRRSVTPTHYIGQSKGQDSQNAPSVTSYHEPSHKTSPAQLRRSVTPTHYIGQSRGQEYQNVPTASSHHEPSYKNLHAQPRRSVTPTHIGQSQGSQSSPSSQQKFSHHIVTSPIMKHRVTRSQTPESNKSSTTGIFLRKPSPTRSTTPAATSKGLAIFLSQLEKNTDPEDRKPISFTELTKNKYTPPPRRRAITPPVGCVTQRPLCSPTPSEGSWETTNTPSPINMKAFTAPSPLVCLQKEVPIVQQELPQHPLNDPPSYSSLICPPTQRNLSPITENIAQSALKNHQKNKPTPISSIQNQNSFNPVPFESSTTEQPSQTSRPTTPSSVPNSLPGSVPGSPLLGRSYRPVTPSGRMSPATTRKYPPGFRSVTPTLGRASPIGSPAAVRKLPQITVQNEGNEITCNILMNASTSSFCTD